MTDTNRDLPQKRTLRLKRETLADLTSPLLSSQGHSLWTCDVSLRDAVANGLPQEDRSVDR